MAAKPRFAVSVRELVESVMLSGDLVRGLGVGGSSVDAAVEGIIGHQEIQDSRPEHYQPEVALSHRIHSDNCSLLIRGRADGIWISDEGIVVDEIKTVSGRHPIEPSPVHFAQGKIYAYILLLEHPVDDIGVQLTYMNRKTREITTFRDTFSREDITAFFEELTSEYMGWMVRHARWCEKRNESIEAMSFPHDNYRAGQRDMAVQVYRTIRDKGKLYIEAPTGIGKTIGVLFPALKSMGEGKSEKLFYLTAKTMGRTVAQKAMDDLRGVGLHCRSVTLTARDKICFHNDEPPCDTSACPFAIGYYDRIKDTISAVLESDLESFTRETIQELAKEHMVCPFELSLDLSVWMDVVVCDYNYAFDPRVYLRRYFDHRSGKYVFLVDESHNLVDRARSMFSAELTKRLVLDVRKSSKSQFPNFSKILHKVNQYFVDMRKDYEAQERPETKGAIVTKELPDKLLSLLTDAMEEAEFCLLQEEPIQDDGQFLELYFQVRNFIRIAALYDERYATLFTARRGHEKQSLLCLDPSALLKKALKRCKSAIFFSATLTPMQYFMYLLGGEEEEDTIMQLPSPFPQENLQVYLNGKIATTYRRREDTLEDLVHTIAGFIQNCPGNCLIFFPSYRYLGMVIEHLEEWYPDLNILVQVPGMGEDEKEQFLKAFENPEQQSLAGFAVMGGIFGEGIDLVGERLIGVVVVGVGMPQLSLERDLISSHFKEQGASGFDYAYTFPGMNRVLQAVGRLIRTETDTGEVLLIDQRFTQSRYRRLFPHWWQPKMRS